MAYGFGWKMVISIIIQINIFYFFANVIYILTKGLILIISIKIIIMNLKARIIKSREDGQKIQYHTHVI